MENCKIDWEDIFCRKISRKGKKGNLSKIKYLNKPYPSIKQIISVIFDEKMNYFAVISAEKIYIFDNFTKQSVKIVNFPDEEIVEEKGIKSLKNFKNHSFYMNDIILTDLNNNESFWVLRANSEEIEPNTTSMMEEGRENIFLGVSCYENKIIFFKKNSLKIYENSRKEIGLMKEESKFESIFGAEEPTEIDYKNLKIVFSLNTQNPQKIELIPFLSTTDNLAFIDYTQKNTVKIFQIAKKDLKTSKTHVLYTYTNNETEWELNINYTIISNFRLSIILFDETNGFFQISKNKKLNFFFKDLLLIGDHEKTRFRHACLSYDLNKQEYLSCVCIVQAHQNLLLLKTHTEGKTEEKNCSKKSPTPSKIVRNGVENFKNKEQSIFYMEIEESKVKAKEIYCNYLWNCFFLMDNDDNLWMLEFFPTIYFQNYWVNFKYIEESEFYEEKEDEFDQPKIRDRECDIIGLIN